MYRVIGHETVVDNDGNKVEVEVRQFIGMSRDEIEFHLQEATIINEKGEEETIDLRYL